MSELFSLIVSFSTMWIVLVGFAVVLNRRDWAAAIARWPLIATLRFVRWAVGGALMALGRWISGRPDGGHRR